MHFQEILLATGHITVEEVNIVMIVEEDMEGGEPEKTIKECADSRREESLGKQTSSYNENQPDVSHEKHNWCQGRNQHYGGSGYQGRGGYERQDDDDRGRKPRSGRRGNRGTHNTKGFHNPEQRAPNS